MVLLGNIILAALFMVHLFVLCLFIAIKLASTIYQLIKTKPLTLPMLRLPISYLCGSTATYWFIERLTVF